MLDSGAYSVWSKGRTIDRDEYVQFCVDHPDVSYYVNLDVIPGKPGQVGGRFMEEAGGFLTFRDLPCADTEKACREGWVNYKALLAVLPEDKVLPVYHHGDDLKWLKKYLDRGAGYLGLGGIARTKASERARWLASLRPYLLNKDGSPKVRTHGLGVTDVAVLAEWPFHSVDSSSWSMAAAMGTVYVPRKRAGRWDYTRRPWLVTVSSTSPKAGRRGQHAASLPPEAEGRVREYLAHVGAPWGESEVVTAPEGHRLRQGREMWVDRAAGLLLRKVRVGVTNSRSSRFLVNYHFMREVEKVFGVEHVYFASGDGCDPHVEGLLGKRLLSYYTLGAGGKDPRETYRLLDDYWRTGPKDVRRGLSACPI